jgi:lysozyme
MGSWLLRIVALTTAIGFGFVLGADSPDAKRLLKEAEADIERSIDDVDPTLNLGHAADASERPISPSCLNPPNSKPIVGVAGVHADGATGFELTGRLDDIPYRTLRQHGIGFAYLRVSRGTSGHEKGFSAAWNNLAKCDIKRGVIHDFKPNQSADKQLANLMAQSNGQFGELPPVVDVERAHGTERHACTKVLANVVDFVGKLKTQSKRDVVIRTNGEFWDNHFNCEDVSDIPDVSILAQSPLWVVDPGKNAPDMPGTWSTWSLWQRSLKGRLGRDSQVPVDQFNGTEQQLIDWISDSQNG